MADVPCAVDITNDFCCVGSQFGNLVGWSPMERVFTAKDLGCDITGTGSDEQVIILSAANHKRRFGIAAQVPLPGSV